MLGAQKAKTGFILDETPAVTTGRGFPCGYQSFILTPEAQKAKLVGPCWLFGVQEHLPGKLQELRLGVQGLPSCAQASLHRLQRSVGVPTIDSQLP